MEKEQKKSSPFMVAPVSLVMAQKTFTSSDGREVVYCCYWLRNETTGKTVELRGLPSALRRCLSPLLIGGKSLDVVTGINDKEVK